jgi:phosphatidylserine/phosphatidylglycerophosphate/cardiolipin synthase-like enzyme
VAERKEFDAKEVLDKYIALIRRTGGRGPQDVSDLPAPKSVIKAVLLHVLQLAPKDSDIAPMKRAFLYLAEFQDQQKAAKASIDTWLTGIDNQTNSQSSDAALREAAQKTVSVRGFLNSLEEQIEAERKSLADELVKAGF